MPRTALRFTATLSLALAALAGCSNGEFNTESTLGGVVQAEAFDSQQRSWLPGASGTNPDAPSVRTDSLSREHWGEYAYTVPVSGVTHYPTYATRLHYTDQFARQRGEFPTVDSALDTSAKDSRLVQVAEGLVWPVWAGIDLGLLPVRAFTNPPWQAVASPKSPPARVPLLSHEFPSQSPEAAADTPR